MALRKFIIDYTAEDYERGDLWGPPWRVSALRFSVEGAASLHLTQDHWALLTPSTASSQALPSLCVVCPNLSEGPQAAAPVASRGGCTFS